MPGQTATLAHRVAHLLVNGADPRRILLMTFSRRAAARLTARVERITAQATGTAVAAEALTWAGTFPPASARILRDHALAVGLHPEFSIHDREDSADLADLCRHGTGFLRPRPLSHQGTCAVYSRAVSAEEPLAEVLHRPFPWVAQWETEPQAALQIYVAAKQAQNVLDYDDLLLARAQVISDTPISHPHQGRWDHVLIDEYEDTSASRPVS
ncbi:MAG: UvrD-helicase domain-containing protein [Paracoccaceae bacterium]